VKSGKENMARSTDLDKLVPTSGNDDGVLGVGAEANARSPLGVALIGDGVLAVTEGVPELDGSVTRTGNNLAVVGREADREDVVGVADESSSGGTSSKLPETQSLVPRGRQSVGTVRRDNTVGDDVRVAVERSLGVAVLGLIAGEVPDDQGLVSGSRQEHVGVLHGGSQASDPAIVALEGSLQDQLFGHFCGDEAMQRIKVREGEEREKSKAALQNLGRVGWEGGCESYLPFFFVWVKN
jgi:hypothetical protein